MTGDCPFCRIFSGEKGDRIIYQDENVIGILDTMPRFAQGQCVVIHRRHVETIYDLEGNEIAELFKAVKTVAGKLKKVFNPPFVSLFVRGQSIPHAHVLVFPSSPLSTLDGFFSTMGALHLLALESTDEKLDDMARKIQDA